MLSLRIKPKSTVFTRFCRRSTHLHRPLISATSRKDYSSSHLNRRMLTPINLALGWPSKSLFPTAALHAATSTILLDPALAADALVYGPDEGYGPLRESLAAWLTGFYCPAAGPTAYDHIWIGNGASAGLSFLLDKFTDPAYTRRVFMVEPTYFLACPIFEDAGFEGRLSGVPEDKEGIDVEFLRRALEGAEKEDGAVNGGSSVQRKKSAVKYPKLYRYVIYAVPTFSNPSGKVMSVQRRRDIVKLAREYDALIITDDVYDMLRWPIGLSDSVTELPPPPPRLCDVDRELPGQTKFGNTVSNGSFSKIAGPGMRVSWVEGTPDFITTLSTHGATRSGGSPGHMSSVFMDQMLRNGSVDKHITEVLVPTYRKRYAALMGAIKKYLEPLEVRVTTTPNHKMEEKAGNAGIVEAGGFFTYINLPDDVQPAENVAKIALDLYALKVVHGGMMIAAGDASSLERAKMSFGRGVRLSWSWHDEQEIQVGVHRLAQVIEDIRAGTVRQQQGEESIQQAGMFDRT